MIKDTFSVLNDSRGISSNKEPDGIKDIIEHAKLRMLDLWIHNRRHKKSV